LLFSFAAEEAEAMATTYLRDELRRLGYQQIELRRSGENRLFLFGKLDGRKHSVLVDTGWSFTTVSTNAAERLKPQHELELQAGSSFPGTNMHSAAVLLNSLRLGRVAFTNQPALVQDMVFNGRRAPFDVVLGCDFLIRNFAVIDCLNRRLYARRQGPSKEQQTEFENDLRQSGLLPVELRRTVPLALACPARLNGEPVELLVDTGAVWSCLDVDLAKSLGLKLLPTPRQISGTGATGRRGFAVAKVHSIELGGAAMRSLNFAVLELGDWGLAAPGAPLAGVRGIIGGTELAAYHAIIDCHGLRLWLKPPPVRR
jgi:predicted aspartyl protease